VPFILKVGDGRTIYAFRTELTVEQLLDPRLKWALTSAPQ
jgi:hypothetical protein